jgi:hypothetical protein
MAAVTRHNSLSDNLECLGSLVGDESLPVDASGMFARSLQFVRNGRQLATENKKSVEKANDSAMGKKPAGEPVEPSTPLDAGGPKPGRTRRADLTPEDEGNQDGLWFSPLVKALRSTPTRSFQ